MNIKNYIAALLLTTSVNLPAIAMDTLAPSTQQALSDEEKHSRLANFMKACRQANVECNEEEIERGKLDLSSKLQGIAPDALHQFYSQLAQLSWLETLYIDGNQLGSISDEVGKLTNITTLFLGANQLKEIPTWVSNLTNLTNLSLFDNQLKSIPAWIGNLSNLISLNLGYNQFESVPEGISQLINLSDLHLNGNQIQLMPIWFSNLINLTSLDLSNNQLTSIPDEINNLTNLADLDFSNNQLRTIPTWITKLTNLTRLNLNSNQLTNIPEDFGDLVNLTTLILYHNQLQVIPESIGKLLNLETLYLGGNQLQTLPSTISNLGALTLLDLSPSPPLRAEGDSSNWGRRELQAHFQDKVTLDEPAATPIPTGLAEEENPAAATQLLSDGEKKSHLANFLNVCRQANVECNEEEIERGKLDLSSKLQGIAPDALHQFWSQLSQLSWLETLYLDGNQLENVPNEIGNLTSLTTLYLANNQLKEIPMWVSNLKYLTTLSLYSNQLKSLSTWIGNLINLTSLDLSYNELENIPDEINHLTNLTSLDLSNNQLKTIPNEISNLKNLTSLAFSGNQLTNIPEGIGDLVSLTVLRFYHNQLQAIPASIGKLINLDTLDLSRNHLQMIPDEINRLTNLTSLDLSNNQLKTIPTWITKLTKLTTFHFGSNQLTTVPEEIGYLVNLTEINLSYNQLQAIPASIGNLVNLIELRLNGNQLPTIPATIRNLQSLTLLDLTSSPLLLPHSDSDISLGRHELQEHFRDRVSLDAAPIEPMSADTTEADVYGPLDAQLIHINREWLQKAVLPTIKTPVLSGEQTVALFNEIMSHLNTKDEKQPGYVSYEMLMDDYATDTSNLSNLEKINKHFVPRIVGFLKTLYGLPLASGETSGWQMYEAQRPQMQQALSFILTSINTDSDVDTRATQMTLVANALLHCPTGQSEGLNTLVSNILAGQEGQTALQLPTRILNQIAVKKNNSFQRAILLKTADNTQNVHWISFYRDHLKDTLGLTAALEGYKEQIGTFGDDPFSGNPYNVLSVFYELVTPARMVDWVMEIIKTPADLKIDEYLGELMHLKAAPKPAIPPAFARILSNLNTQLDRLQRNEVPAEFQAEIQNLSEPERSTWIKNKTEELQSKAARLNQQLQPKSATISIPSPELVAYLKSKNLLPENAEPTNTPLTQEVIQAAEKALKEIIKDNAQFRPVLPSDILGYMVDNKIVNVEAPNWWQEYFTADPTSQKTATPTPKAIEAILIHLGALKVLDVSRSPE